MAEEPQYHNIDGKPLFDILSKLPSKSLLRFRCVSKLWREYIDDSYFVSIHDKQVIEDPTPILFYIIDSELAKTICFHTLESDTISNHVLKAKNKVPVFEFVAKKPLYETCMTEFVCSCNGLVLIETDDTADQDETDLMPTFTVIHPIIKQCYVLPKSPLRVNRESCGLGFDSSTNTFKMVCVYSISKRGRVSTKVDQCTIVHVFGTNSWREIPQVPSYPIEGEAIFGNGCLHWLVRYNHEDDGTRQVIWFDVKNEEFGLIKPPKTISKPSRREFNHPLNDRLVNLDGQVGYFCNKTEVWVLNNKKEWVLHCDFEDHKFPYGFIKVLGCLNKEGDILIKIIKADRGKELFYIYNRKNRVVHEAHIDDLDLEDKWKTNIVMFPNSLFDIITNSNLIKSKELEENMLLELVNSSLSKEQELEEEEEEELTEEEI